MKSLTILFPIHPEENQIQNRVSDLESFFSKWPLVTDLLFILEPGSEKIRDVLKVVKHEKIQTHFIQNKSFLGRAQSLQKGLATATGDLVILGSFDLSIPMAEYFNLIHEAISVPDADIFKGNRFSSRKKQMGARRKWHRILDDIILEKWRLSPQAKVIQDPLCNLYAVRQTVVEKWRAQKPLKQWYYGLDILHWAATQAVKVVEIPVVNSVDEKSKIKVLKEYFRHAFSSF